MSTRIGPKFFKIVSNELQSCQQLPIKLVKVALPNIHILHAHYNVIVVAHERAVVANNIRRIAFLHDAQFTHDTFLYFRLCFNMYDLTFRSANVLPNLTMITLTFRAMICFVATCCTFATVPPLPAPSSFSTIKSSFRKSSLSSRPISSESSFRSFFSVTPVSMPGARARGPAVRARPLTFFRFKVFCANDMTAE